MLETHRHKGVDFVIVTQSPMLLDQNVRRLVGRHQHVRRLLGMQRAIIYDWDGCSQTMKPASSTGKTFFNYPKSAYALYKSSELHTKQRQKIPWVIFIPVLAIVGAFTIGPKAFAAFSGAVSGKGVQGISGTAAAPKPAASAPVPVSTVPGAPAGFVQVGDNTPKPAPLEFPQLVKQTPIAGCIFAAGRCGCFDVQGIKVEATEIMCKEKTGDGMGKAAEFPDSPRLTVITEAEAETIRFAFLKK
jgi:zona occludens toxin